MERDPMRRVTLFASVSHVFERRFEACQCVSRGPFFGYTGVRAPPYIVRCLSEHFVPTSQTDGWLAEFLNSANNTNLIIREVSVTPLSWPCSGPGHT
jgi:hypothetical protein